MYFIKKYRVFTIPNLLSFIRLVLAILFWIVYQDYGLNGKRELLISILAISAITDYLDGKIARRFHMVSEFGKMLDPIADKVTQGILLLSFFSEYQTARVVFVLFVIKESFMFVSGTKIIIKNRKNEGAMWYGKVSTGVFYFVMAVLLVFPGISEKMADVMIGISGIWMFIALLLYARRYRYLSRSGKVLSGQRDVRKAEI